MATGTTKYEREQEEKRQQHEAAAHDQPASDKLSKDEKAKQEKLEKEHPQASPHADRRPRKAVPQRPPSGGPNPHPYPTDPDRPDLGVTSDPILPTYQDPNMEGYKSPSEHPASAK